MHAPRKANQVADCLAGLSHDMSFGLHVFILLVKGLLSHVDSFVVVLFGPLALRL